MTAAEEIDRLVAGLTDWRGETLAQVRAAIRATDPAIVETWKWMGSPVWERDGIICVGNAHKEKVKLTFAEGAQLPDPDGLFNAGLDGGKWRAIDLAEGEAVRAPELQAMVRAAIAFNQAKQATRRKPPKPSTRG
ncbi:MAG: DUF1801 domain-containing protein [Caulobacteraceae bacterium]|nr:DUF1801 domain-containing protein [Caulobacter sp.]